MRRNLALAIVVFGLGAGQALADCPYVAWDRTAMEFVDDGENTVIIQHQDGQTEICSWARSDTGAGSTLACDGAEAKDFERSADGKTLDFRGVTWRPDCGAMSVSFEDRADDRLIWSQTSVPPFASDQESAGSYPLRPDANGWAVARVESMRAWLTSDVEDADFEIVLINLHRLSKWRQVLEIWMWVGPDGYRILWSEFDGLPYDKLAVRGDALLAKPANRTTQIDLDWQALSRHWVEANFNSDRAWDGVLDGTGPIPWDEVTSAIELWDELNQTCRGGAGDEQATLATCDERDELYAAIVSDYGYCYGTLDQAGYEYEWHRCGENSNRY